LPVFEVLRQWDFPGLSDRAACAATHGARKKGTPFSSACIKSALFGFFSPVKALFYQ
jgi:hypothetical protein